MRMHPWAATEVFALSAAAPVSPPRAVDTAKRWRYQPTQLNGVGVPVVMTVTVAFR